MYIRPNTDPAIRSYISSGRLPFGGAPNSLRY